jgi:hypothetical protein
MSWPASQARAVRLDQGFVSMMRKPVSRSDETGVSPVS